MGLTEPIKLREWKATGQPRAEGSLVFLRMSRPRDLWTQQGRGARRHHRPMGEQIARRGSSTHRVSSWPEDDGLL